jgi:fructose-bisphosphate aldolase, class I
MNARPELGQLGLSAGKKARLHRILYQHGLSNGTAIFLPYDQGLEHGPRDFFANPAASDPKYIIRLALEGGFNGIAIQIGLGASAPVTRPCLRRRGSPWKPEPPA